MLPGQPSIKLTGKSLIGKSLLKIDTSPIPSSSYPHRSHIAAKSMTATPIITTTEAKRKHRMVESTQTEEQTTKRPKLSGNAEVYTSCSNSSSAPAPAAAPIPPKSDAQKWQEILDRLNSTKAIRDSISDKLDRMAEVFHSSDGLVLGMHDELDRIKRQLQGQSDSVGDETQRSERALE